MMVSVMLALVLQCIVLFGTTVDVHVFYTVSAVESNSYFGTYISSVVMAVLRQFQSRCTVCLLCTS